MKPSNKYSLAIRLGSAVVGMGYAGLLTGFVQDLWRRLGPVPLISIFIVLWIVSYQGLLWLFVDRTAELEKKFPITSQELRRRKKAFYDWYCRTEQL